MTATRDDNDCQAWEWIDADGVSWRIDLTTDVVAGQSHGTGVPPVRRVDVRVPGRPGAFTLDRSYAEKSVALQVTFVGDGCQGVEEALAAWATRCNVLRGGGALARTRADGLTRRLLYCDYDDGLTIDQSGGLWEQGAQPAVLVFYAADPFWYDDADTVIPFTVGTGTFFFPIPNPTTGSFVTLVSTEVFGVATVNNDGDSDAYPVWEITGPGEVLKLRNLLTGAVLDFTDDGSLVLAAGDVLTIDTRPGFTTISLADGTNVANYLTDASTLWPLVLGAQTLQVEMINATVDSAVTFTYRRKHLTP